MPTREAPCIELGSAPEIQSLPTSSSPSDLSSASSPEPHQLIPTPLFRAMTMPPLPPVQPDGQEELERRLPGYRRFVLPREQTLIDVLKQSSGVRTDEEVLSLRSVKISVVAEHIGLRSLYILIPRLRDLNLDGSVLGSLRDLGTGLSHLKELHVCRCGLTSLDGIVGLRTLRELYASGNRITDLAPLAILRKLHTLDLSKNPISETTRIWTLRVCCNLRRLWLRGSPVASNRDYHRRITSTLPSLQYLDDFPLNESALNELDEFFGPVSSSSSSDSEPEEKLNQTVQENDVTSDATEDTQEAPRPLPATEVRLIRRRPATAPCVANPAPAPARRPHTAHHVANEYAATTITSLELLNSLIDEESRCSGSQLTSGAVMCGNLARALRPRRLSSSASSSSSRNRSNNECPPHGCSSHTQSTHVCCTPGCIFGPCSSAGCSNGGCGNVETSRSFISAVNGHIVPCPYNNAMFFFKVMFINLVKENTVRKPIHLAIQVEAVAAASRMLATEIPYSPGPADWAHFRRTTGIDFNLDSEDRPGTGDVGDFISRLEQIERETKERLRREELKRAEVHDKPEDVDDLKMKLLDRYFREE